MNEFQIAAIAIACGSLTFIVATAVGMRIVRGLAILSQRTDQEE